MPTTLFAKKTSAGQLHFNTKSLTASLFKFASSAASRLCSVSKHAASGIKAPSLRSSNAKRRAWPEHAKTPSLEILKNFRLFQTLPDSSMSFQQVYVKCVQQWSGLRTKCFLVEACQEAQVLYSQWHVALLHREKSGESMVGSEGDQVTWTQHEATLLVPKPAQMC